MERLLVHDAPALVWSDPPYGQKVVKQERGERAPTVGRSKPFGSRHGKIGDHNKVRCNVYPAIIGDDSTETAEKSYALIAGPGGVGERAVQVWWGANMYSQALPASRCWLVWDKVRTGCFAACELAYTNLDAPVKLFTHQWNGMIRASERGRRMHPTQKPVALAEWAFAELGKSDSVILDPFCGAGMSILAAERLNARDSGRRRVFAAELSDDYCTVVLNRWENETGGRARLISGA
jgi:hypothetical protein